MEITSQTTALITGANGGIGQAIARALAGAGARLVLSARRADAVRGIAEELGARVVIADLATPGAARRLHDEAGPVDIVVANAGLPAAGSTLDFEVEEIDAILDVNLRVPLLLTRHYAPGMVERGRGHFVYISSISGKISTTATALYSATKFGLRGFALGLRSDLAERGVGVTVIYPGFIRDAGMFADTGVKLPFGMGTRTPGNVATAVLDAVHDNPAEISVAAFDQRIGAFFANLAPGLVAPFEKAFGGDKLSAEMVAAQRGKRR
jgi:short-subunit dehydrogenase